MKASVSAHRVAPPLKTQLLKWVGNKQRMAAQIVSCFPNRYRTYYEPFLGSGAVLATLCPRDAVGSDSSAPLIGIWKTLQANPRRLKRWYADRWRAYMDGPPRETYGRIRDAYNRKPNAADLLFICRSCYGGVVRFRNSDGGISTPVGTHRPVAPERFAERVDTWAPRVADTAFDALDYAEALERPGRGDLVYCDPPYRHSQSILYGAQSFDFEHLVEQIARCKSRGSRVALSIDGSKRSGAVQCELPLPKGLFEREIAVRCGRSMLKRFQMNGKSLEREEVQDRLLLTW